jgi:hypothetical protein
MNYWAVDGSSTMGETPSILIQQKNKPAITEGDEVVIFRRDREGVFFTANGIAADVRIDVVNGSIAFSFVVANLKLLEPARRLFDFAYSLVKIYRYLQPWRHFQRRYVSLVREDFRTLVDARIFWSRTAFGMFVNHLPEAALARFVQSVAIDSPRTLVDQRTFDALWNFLRQFIVGQYLGAHALTDAISNLAMTFTGIGGNFDFENVTLGNGEGEPPDSLALQHRRLSVFFQSTLPAPPESKGLLDLLDQRIADTVGDAADFEKLFRGIPWPMQPTLL